MFIERAIVMMQRRARGEGMRLMQYAITPPALARMYAIESDWWYGRWNRDGRRRERFHEAARK